MVIRKKKLEAIRTCLEMNSEGSRNGGRPKKKCLDMTKSVIKITARCDHR